jgi:hypothetical protein
MDVSSWGDTLINLKDSPAACGPIRHHASKVDPNFGQNTIAFPGVDAIS